ncbi:hypothetical protein BpHYR1_035223 [Brachionus plicatilis]|uniref:Uncharacterized protein n=1 Tax=Brachionus plicatilis TaxID=10195 RepID=A0A3M7T9G1_BRAPC|nr:hypothetical protein BpHYR1_035223 [Brachionus plicatilis]
MVLLHRFHLLWYFADLNFVYLIVDEFAYGVFFVFFNILLNCVTKTLFGNSNHFVPFISFFELEIDYVHWGIRGSGREYCKKFFIIQILKLKNIPWVGDFINHFLSKSYFINRLIVCLIAIRCVWAQVRSQKAKSNSAFMLMTPDDQV